LDHSQTASFGEKHSAFIKSRFHAFQFGRP
jgi:hypothetical protein